MKRLSEVLKYYESKKYANRIEEYFSEGHISRKIYDIKNLIEILGDVEIEIDLLKAFLYNVSPISPVGQFGMTKVDFHRKIKTIYELTKDSKLSSETICTLFNCYKTGAYELFKEDIKSYITSDKCDDKILTQLLHDIASKATLVAQEEALKLEDYKEEYGEEFITMLQDIVEEKIIPFDRVVSILPSKELIDSSTVQVPYFGYEIISGEELVERRLKGYIQDEQIEQTKMDAPIKLGSTSAGPDVYTSFTKKEYYESLGYQKPKTL